MIARCVFYTETTVTAAATVVLTPCWLARLLGARERSIDLRRDSGGWHAVATRRAINHYFPRHTLIINALDFREVGSPARWSLGSGSEAVAP